MTGFYNATEYNHNGGVLGNLRGIQSVLTLTDGSVGNGVARHMQGFNNQCAANGGTVTGSLYTNYNYTLVDGATIDGNVRGIYNYVNLDTGVVSGAVYGIHSQVDDAIGAAGSVRNLYLINGAGVDYAIYSDGTAPHYFAGAVGIGEATPQRLLHVDGRVRIDDGIAAPAMIPVPPGGIDYYWGADFVAFLCDPDIWLRIDIEGATYKIPCYS